MPKAKIPNPKNENILIYVNGEILPREDAKISVFDSLVQGGDGVWEGLRVYDGKVFLLEEHLDRLVDSAKAMAFSEIPSIDSIKKALFDTLRANEMRDGVHIRLTLSRGKKVTSGMSPHWNQYGPTLIIIPEWKPPVFDSKGVRLITSSIRRNPPGCIDSKIHHNNLINNILAKIEANLAGVDDAVMLDLQGFVAETNATNLFFVKGGNVKTPFPDACTPGITRKYIFSLSKELKIVCEERRISMTEMYSSDEAFITGTMGEITPVVEIDGRKIPSGPVIPRLQELFKKKTAELGTKLPF